MKAHQHLTKLISIQETKAREEQIMQDELSLLDSDNFSDIDESTIIQWRIDQLKTLNSNLSEGDTKC